MDNGSRFCAPGEPAFSIVFYYISPYLLHAFAAATALVLMRTGWYQSCCVGGRKYQFPPYFGILSRWYKNNRRSEF